MSTIQRMSEQTARRIMRTRLLCWSLALCALAGCTTLKEVPTTHIVMANGRGNPVDPTGNFWCREKPDSCAENKQEEQHVWFSQYREMQRGSSEVMPPRPAAMPGSYEKYLNDLFDDLLRNAPTDKDGKRRILMFIHGGLNTQTGTVERAVELQRAIAKEGYYPIFINWQSSLFSSYGDHLVNVRQGESWDNWGWILTPFYFITDVARAVTRAPVVWYFLLRSDVRTHKWITTDSQREVEHIAKELALEYEQAKLSDDKPASNVLRISFDHNERYDQVDRRGSGEQALAVITGLLTVPTKMISSMFIDAFGKSAWDIMLRRTHMLYHTEREFLDSEEVAAESGIDDRRRSKIKADGALSVFIRGLQQRIEKNGGPDKWDIALVGHSMGTIVMSEMLHDFSDLPFNHIVYMAAAVTVRDYEDSLFPYLKKNGKAKVYHLMLHQKAEVLERFDPGIPYVDLPPRGSLLVWIDDFLSSPETPLDRTLGRFDNFIVTVHDIPPELRGRIHAKAFGVGSQVQAPKEHGDFTARFKFWKESCWWNPEPELPPGCYTSGRGETL